MAINYMTMSGKINLHQVKLDIDSVVSGESLETQMSHEKANEIIHTIFDEVKKFLVKNEVNIVEAFLDSDENDGYLDKNELASAFSRVGVPSLDNEQQSALFSIFDPYMTNKVDQQ